MANETMDIRTSASTRPTSDVDTLPDDMDFDDRVDVAVAPEQRGEHCFDLEVAAAQRSPADS